MFLRVQKPQKERYDLESRLYDLDFRYCGPDWMYTSQEKSSYMIRRMKLVKELEEFEDWVDPGKLRFNDGKFDY